MSDTANREIEHEHEHEEVEVEEEEERTSNGEAGDHQHVFVIPSSFVIRASAFQPAISRTGMGIRENS